MEVQELRKSVESAVSSIELGEDLLAFFLQVEPAKFLGIKHSGKIKGLDQDFGRVPPVPEPKGVKNLFALHSFDGRQPAVLKDLFNRYHPFFGEKISLDENDIRVPLDNLFEGDDGLNASQGGGQEILRQVDASSAVHGFVENGSPRK